MIFVTVGSQRFQFNRLLKKVDELINQGIIKDGVFAQTGCSDYMPQNYRHKDFVDREEFAQIMSRCDMVITHGGTGVIIGAVKQGKKVIAVPRLAKYAEHVDDHQLQLIEQFAEMHLICDCKDVDELENAIEKAYLETYLPYQSNTESIINSLAAYLESI